jgi:hypothetical protein
MFLLGMAGLILKWIVSPPFYKPAITVYSAGDGRITSASTWVLLSSGDNLPEIDAPALGVRAEAGYARTIHPWTDDYSNLIQILNR